MAKVPSKLPVAIPKRLAEQYGIASGHSILFQEAGDVIPVIPTVAQALSELGQSQRLALFDAGTHRQRDREARESRDPIQGRGWTRAELYRGGSVD